MRATLDIELGTEGIVACEAFSPEGLGKHDHRRRPFAVVVWLEQPAVQRARLQGGEEARVDDLTAHDLGSVGTSEHEALVDPEAHGLETERRFRPCANRRRTGREAIGEGAESNVVGFGPVAPGLPQADQPVRIRVGQRIQQDAVDHTVDRGRGPDRQSHDADDGERYPWPTPQGTHRFFQVQQPAAHGALLLADVAASLHGAPLG